MVLDPAKYLPDREKKMYEKILDANLLALLAGDMSESDIADATPNNQQAIKGTQKARERLAMLKPNGVRQAAGKLDHSRSADIISWGKEVEQALGDYITSEVRDARQHDLNAGKKSEKALSRFAERIEQKDVGAVRRFLINSRLATMHPLIFTDEKAIHLKQKIAPWDQKMDRNLDAMTALERHYNDDIEQAQSRIDHYKGVNETLEKIDTLLRSYHDCLVDERQRLVHAEARAFQNPDKDPQSLSARAMGQAVKRGIAQDIDARLESLRTSMRMGETAYLQFFHLQQRQESRIESMDFFKSRQLPLFRQQLLQAVDIKLGRSTAFNDAASAPTSRLFAAWRRKDPAQPLIEGVAHAVQSEQDRRKEERIGVQEDIQRTETLMIENLRPIALLEAPRKEDEKEPVPLPVSHLDRD
jgi:hypothetical protein